MSNGGDLGEGGEKCLFFGLGGFLAIFSVFSKDLWLYEALQGLFR